MLKIKGKTVSLHKDINLNKKQLNRLESFKDKNKQLDYLFSILGKRAEYLYIDKKESTGRDFLAQKSSGSILRKFNDLLDSGASKNYKPLTVSKNSQWVGVEIECYIKDFDTDEEGCECEYCHGSGEESCGNCEGDGYVYTEDAYGNEYRNECGSCDGNGTRICDECDGESSSEGSSDLSIVRSALTKAKVPRCSVRTDGSLSSGGLEVCILFDASKGFGPLEKLCKVLNSLDASINTDCGLHVHLDYSDKINSTQQLDAIGKHFAKFLPVLSQFLPSSRRDNRYCKLVASKTDRYSAINLTSFNKHRTIEVRLHSGTTNFTKIKNWIELLTVIKNRYDKKRPFTSIKNFQRFIDVLELPNNLVEYYDKRLQKFNPSEALPNVECRDCDNEESGIELLEAAA